MNLALEEDEMEQISNLVIEEEDSNMLLVRFQHEQSADINFHIETSVFAMTNIVELADLFLKAAYNTSLFFDETMN